MFESLPHCLRKYKLSADVRTLLMLRKALDRGLVNTLGDIYLVLKGLVAHSPKDFGPYTTAFYEYFLSVDIKKGESLEAAILRSEAFKNWREKQRGAYDDEEAPDMRELIDRFLNEVHMTTLDIKKLISGEDILKNDDPDMPDTNPQENTSIPDTLREMADYSKIPLEELRERLRRIAEQQKMKHSGGNHWMGVGGKSPFGHQGAALGGIRVGGNGGGKMARAVVGDARFYPVDVKSPLKDDNMDVALANLKGIESESIENILDIPKTIKEGLKQGGYLFAL